MTAVITHGGPDRRHKLCRCSKCGGEEVCTPARDFYTTDKQKSGPLLCTDCFDDYCRSRGVQGGMFFVPRGRVSA